jgi:purine-binding chemotaxis protein CheW
MTQSDWKKMAAMTEFDNIRNADDGQIHNETAHELPLDALVAQINAEISRAPSVDATDGDGRLTFEPESTLRLKQHVEFSLGRIMMSVPLSGTLEIGYQPKTTPLPNLPDWILGIANIRGEIISVVDLKGFLKLPSRQLNRKKRFIIVFNQEMKVGVLVDKVYGLFSPDQVGAKIIENPSDMNKYLEYRRHKILEDYISGIFTMKNQFVNMIDIDKLLSSSRMNAFRGE